MCSICSMDMAGRSSPHRPPGARPLALSLPQSYRGQPSQILNISRASDCSPCCWASLRSLTPPSRWTTLGNPHSIPDPVAPRTRHRPGHEQALMLVQAYNFADVTQAAPARGQETEQFNWTKQWYPMAAVQDLDPAKPHGTKLLGELAAHPLWPLPTSRFGRSNNIIYININIFILKLSSNLVLRIIIFQKIGY